MEDDYSLLPLAECMERAERRLAATVIYRALTVSILKRAVTKYYHHGVRYLRQLDVIAGKISEWRVFMDRKEYLDFLRQTHGRKSSFWKQYGR